MPNYMASSFYRQAQGTSKLPKTPTISVTSLVEWRAKMFLSKEAFALFRAMVTGVNDQTSYKTDLIVYGVSPKEWVEALTFAMEVGRG